MTRYPETRPNRKRCVCCWLLVISAGAKRRKCQQCRNYRCRAPNCNVVGDRMAHPETLTPSAWAAHQRRARSVQGALDSTMIEPSKSSAQPTLFDVESYQAPPRRRTH